MKLQQQVLNHYQEYHRIYPTLVQLIVRNLGRYLLIIAVAALVLVLSYALERPAVANFVLGLLIGALLRDLGTFIQFTKTWPIIDPVLDWDRIEALLEK